MCELFGLSSNRAVRVSFTWRGFRKKGRVNRDGWGIAWYLEEGLAGLVKEPRPAPDSPIAKLMVQGVRSNIIISHVRLATTGELSYVNTHPFVRKLWDRDWVFAHNGNVSRIIYEPGYRLKHCIPVGDTDSEHAFCYMLERLRGMDRSIDDLESLSKRLWSLATNIGGYGKFNFLLSNGEYLFAYMNQAGTLHYILRHPPHRGVVRLLDEDYEIRLEELKARNEYAALVATNPLTNEDWVPMEPGTLYVFYNGDILIIINKKGQPKLKLSSIETETLRYIRSSPHSVALGDLARALGLDPADAYETVDRLKNKGLLRQHSRDTVPPEHPRARYYTNPSLRRLIDEAIKST